MRERPILFSAAMVRALRAGTKTQTRRVIKDQFVGEHFCEMRPEGAYLEWLGAPNCGTGVWEVPEHNGIAKVPFGTIGDRLWVREAWRSTGGGWRTDGMPPRDMRPHAVWYQADGDPPADECAGKLRPSMFMPRWASRITLEVAEVRVERLQDISARDAMAEGAEPLMPDIACTQVCPEDYVAGYRAVWESINGAGSWDSNPWVWAVSFKAVQ